MTIESLLYSRLQSIVSGRVYPQKFPQQCVYPAIRYQLVSRERTECMGSFGGIYRSNFQIDIINLQVNYTSLLSTYASVVAQIERWVSSSDGIQDSFVTDEQEFYDDDLLVARRLLRVDIFHQSL